MKILGLITIGAIVAALAKPENKKTVDPRPTPNYFARRTSILTRQQKVIRLMNIAVQDKNHIKQIQAMYLLNRLKSL